jgi:alanine-glyoxylate transaminase/serine-glyoxylate transaminase/serine-pyruvate transaminase
MAAAATVAGRRSITMKPGVHHLCIPGPTNVPECVRRAMNMPMQDHRAPDLPALTLPLFEDLKRVFRTETGRIMLFPGSGTGAWEAAITNTLSPGDRVLMARHGQFSLLWVEMAERLGLDVEVIDLTWGAAAPVAEFGRRLAADRAGRIRAVFVTQNETATGVTSDVPGVRAALDAAGHDALLFVDGVSSIASIDFRMDEWGVDLAVTGSQKGLMLPAGLGVLGVSEKALEAAGTAKLPRAYFHFGDMIRTNADGYFPYTPPVALLHGLRAALDRLFAEGLERVITRHRRLADGVRAAVDAWGLALAAERPSIASDTVTAIRTPEGTDARVVIRTGFDRYNASFGAGLGPLAGKVFRIGHLGDLNEGMALAALGCAELSMLDAGVRIEPGSGVAAAQRAWIAARESAPVPVAAE